MLTTNSRIEDNIVKKALELGASLAGIARISDLKASPSYQVYAEKPFYESYPEDDPNYFKFKGVDWRPEYKSVLVWALEHPESEPALDWWSMKVPGFTPGNGIMRRQSKQLRIWLEEDLGISALSLPYQIEFGGAFLKDSAVLAGLGVFGKHNLLVTPGYGTRVRLRGIFIEADLEPTGPIDFNPCDGCGMPCHAVCPQEAFRSGSYERALCKLENDKRDAAWEMLPGEVMGIEEASQVVKPCRYCELACPIGQ
jgi:epoxyqueuosine reductase